MVGWLVSERPHHTSLAGRDGGRLEANRSDHPPWIHDAFSLRGSPESVAMPRFVGELRRSGDSQMTNTRATCMKNAASLTRLVQAREMASIFHRFLSASFSIQRESLPTVVIECEGSDTSGHRCQQKFWKCRLPSSATDWLPTFFNDSQPNRLRLEFLIKRKTELTHMKAYAQCKRMQQMAVIPMNRGHEQSITQKVKPNVAGETRFGQPAGRIRHSATSVLLF